jgi:TRAP transporter TAXI family solute receptor
LVNKGRDSHGVRCYSESTTGSLYNLNMVRLGEPYSGIVQGNTAGEAYRGTGDFKELGAIENLRLIMKLFPEALTVVASADSGIQTTKDLRGKRVNLGPVGSGTRALVESLMTNAGLKYQDFALATELKPQDSLRAFCDKKLDVLMFVVGNPNEGVKTAIERCGGRLVPSSAEDVDRFVKSNPGFSSLSIPGGTYKAQAEDIATIGTYAYFVAADGLEPSQIYHVTKAVFEQLDQFKSLHPALSNLQAAQMVPTGSDIPLHPGAERYFKEAGLLK